MLEASWRQGTQRYYSVKVTRFCSWYAQREIDPYSATLYLVQVTEFLTSLFNKGLKYRTVAGYRSMLSKALPPVGHIPIGQHPYVTRLLRPPEVKLVPE